MKIVIMGYSGSGKSTLSRKLGEKYQVPVLHLDTVHFLQNWQIRSDADKQNIVRSFLDNNTQGWIIDGNYSKLYYDRRIDEADIIIQLLFGRFNCLFRCAKRYHIYKGKNRPDMTNGCNEKLDLEFIKWILFGGRFQETRDRYKQTREKYPQKEVVIKNQKRLNAYLKSLDIRSLCR